MADPSEFWDTQSKKCIVCARPVAYKVMCVSCKSLFHYSCTQRGSCCIFPRLVNEEGTEFPNVYLTTHGGPMMRSSMFMHPQQQQQLQQQQLQQQQLQQQQQHQLQQQHQQQMVPQRSAAMYARQQGPMANMDAVQHNSPEWRQLIMAQQQQQQQQQAGFGGAMRHNFQQGFNMSSNSMQMTAMQHQQLRVSRQEQMSQAQAMAAQGNPMAQMSSMNQAMMHMHQQQQQQQQQNLLQQQQSQHMSNLHMQQSQSMTIPSQQQQQQQQQPQQPAQSHPNQLMGATGGGPSNAMASYNPQTDFNFEFLDNLGTGDNPAFTDQDLLNSFDTDAGFNLDF